jgi:pimeloyl-ACP methyl ester carboxylesterase
MHYHRIPALSLDRPERVCFLLHGAYQSAQSFLEEGFVSCFQALDPGCELVLLEAHAQYYLEQNLVDPLHTAIQGILAELPARIPAQLLGISMGGYGALRYVMAKAPAFDQILLLAPFLGERRTWLSIKAQGGLGAWQPPAALTAQDDSDLWAWLQDPAHRCPLVLGYGRQDRFNRSHQLLAEALAPTQVICQEGDHDWTSWKQLLPDMLKVAQGIHRRG